MLELKDGTLRVDGRELFRRLSFMALDGQLTCITGPSGSGKTMLVRALLGLQPLDEGLVSIDGELLTPLSAPTFRQLMAYVPQRLTVTLTPTTVDTEGLETVWSPLRNRPYKATVIDEHLDVAPLASKPIILADDPDSTMLSMLKSLAAANHTVIVTTERDEYLNLSDKTIFLGNHDLYIR